MASEDLVQKEPHVVNPLTARSAPDVVASEQAAPRRRAPQYIIWTVPGLLTCVLGLVEINVPMVWRDELATWSASTRSWSQLWAMLHNIDAVLGVYYAGMHVWIGAFGDSPAAMRLPSVFAMAVAAAVVALTGKRLGGTRAGLISGLIFAIIPSVSRYAQEARPYAFATLFSALATLFLLRAMDRPNWFRWALYAVALGLAGASNLVALCVIAGHAVIVILDFLLRTLRVGGQGDSDGRVIPGGRPEPIEGRPLPLIGWFCVSAIVGVFLDTPLVLVGHQQSSSQIGYQTVPHFAELAGISGGLYQSLFASTPVAVIVILLALASLVWVQNARQRVLAVYALACAFLPIVAVWIISLGPDSYWVYRYMLFTVPAWAIAAGLGVSGIAERVSRNGLPRLRNVKWLSYGVVAGLLVVVTGLAGSHDQLAVRTYEAHNLWAYPVQEANGEPVDYPAAAAVLAANARPGDGVIYQAEDANHYEVDAAIAYYLQGKRVPALQPVFQSATPVQSNSLQPVQCSNPSDCLTGTPRIWVVYVNYVNIYAGGTANDPFDALPADEAGYLQILGYQVQTIWPEDGITVALLTV